MTKVLTIALIAAMFPAIAFADEGVVTRLHDNTYSVDQTWEGTVIIDGVVQFAPGTTLTIEPGTVVKFTRVDTDGDGIGENELYVQGRLVAKGTEERPILFTSAEERPAPGDWGAVNIMVSEGRVNELTRCVIEYGYRGFHMHFSKAELRDCKLRHNYLGIQCQDSELSITGCEVTDNKGAIVFKDSKLKVADNRISDNYWGIRFLYGEAELTGNTITGNTVNGVTFRENKVRATGNTLKGNRKGFSAESAEVELKDNVITGNDESGVYLKRSKGVVAGNDITGNGNAGVSVEDSDVRITGNDIVANANFGIDNNGKGDVDARGNWWGTPDAGAVAKMVYDKASDPALGRVLYTPMSGRPFVAGR
jgi:parallel beta-helix repeat protein